MSSFISFRMPNSTSGSALVHEVSWHLRAAFRRRCSLSTKPLLMGWYAVVRILCVPVSVRRFEKSCDSNWVPRSVVICVGTPNRAIHVFTNASAQVSAVMSGIGIASGHLVKRSTIVRRYCLPADCGKGPTIQYVCERTSHQERKMSQVVL